ncbi:MAG: SusC/RagA family TonB-linked outer membrane protein, partial [Pedobacter sp.]
MYKIYAKPTRWRNHHVPKILLIMKLVTVLMIAMMMQVSAASFAQKLTLKVNNIDLQQLFKEIRKQTGYAVIYTAATINDGKTIDANYNSTPLDEVLNNSLANQNLIYEIDGKNIIITRKATSILDKIFSVATINIRGRIADQNGTFLPGATVRIKGTGKRTQSDSEGNFYFNNIDEKAIIIVSFIGYDQVELPANSEMGIIRMNPIAGQLQEVTVNKGYYTENQKLATGNTVTVTAKDIEKQPVLNPMLALQGRVAGLQITQTSGIVNGPVNMLIRGRSSLNDIVGNSPLFVVDGIPFQSAL